MRLVGRILVLCAGVTLSAVVAVIGCVVDSDRYPGIENAVPNSRSGATSPTSSASSSSSGSGMPPPICQCAPTINSPDGGACATCGGDAVKAGGACELEQQGCMIDNTCPLVIPCMVNCPAGPTYEGCIEGCIKGSPVYQALATCQCNACASACAVATPLPCNLGTGGGGTGGAGTGGAGTGGAAPDAGSDAGDGG